MLTSILSAVCALALGTSAMTSQADTVNVYMINGEKITNFDGSQIVGKTVSDYKIGVATNNATGEVSKVHIIKTEDPASPLTGNGGLVMGMDVIYVVDGVKTSSLDFIKIKQENIGSMTVCKEAMEWTDDENVNVLKFETKRRMFISLTESKFLQTNSPNLHRKLFLPLIFTKQAARKPESGLTTRTKM